MNELTLRFNADEQHRHPREIRVPEVVEVREMHLDDLGKTVQLYTLSNGRTLVVDPDVCEQTLSGRSSRR